MLVPRACGSTLLIQFLPRGIPSPRTSPTPSDAQVDREKINPEANEYAKSGTDNTAAKNDEAAFDPNITDPQEAKKKAGEGNTVNPLDASPAKSRDQ